MTQSQAGIEGEREQRSHSREGIMNGKIRDAIRTQHTRGRSSRKNNTGYRLWRDSEEFKDGMRGQGNIKGRRKISNRTSRRGTGHGNKKINLTDHR